MRRFKSFLNCFSFLNVCMYHCKFLHVTLSPTLPITIISTPTCERAQEHNNKNNSHMFSINTALSTFHTSHNHQIIQKNQLTGRKSKTSTLFILLFLHRNETHTDIFSHQCCSPETKTWLRQSSTTRMTMNSTYLPTSTW